MRLLGTIALSLLLLVGCGGSDDDASSEEPIIVDTSGGGEEEPPPNDDPEPDTGAEEGELVVGNDACETDADCVPAGCCHPAACVAQANAPSCGDVMCTADCQPNTMDCGGGCLCFEGHCAARLANVPRPRVAE